MALSDDEERVLKSLAQFILRGATGAPASSSSAGGGRGGGGGEVASDSDLDGQYGDPTIKFDPKRWSGESYVGSTYSRSEPAYLDAVAEALEWSANNPRPGKEKYASYDRRDAARARGWAARLRAKESARGGKRGREPEHEEQDNGDEIPF